MVIDLQSVFLGNFKKKEAIPLLRYVNKKNVRRIKIQIIMTACIFLFFISQFVTSRFSQIIFDGDEASTNSGTLPNNLMLALKSGFLDFWSPRFYLRYFLHLSNPS